MARKTFTYGDTSETVKGVIDDNFIELYDISITTKQGWGYQDFTAGVLGTSVTLTENSNGSDITFDSSKVVGGSAAICLTANNLQVPYTGTTTFFSSKVGVTANSGNSVTLSGIPHASWGGCRIFYLYNYENKIPDGNILAPKFISEQILTALNTSFVTEEEITEFAKTKSGSINLVAGTRTITFTTPFDNTNYIPKAEGFILATEEEIGVKIIRNSKTINGFNVDIPQDCTVEWIAIKY